MADPAVLMRLFGIRYPIIQAPMAGAAGGDLAREVARAGGLGMVGTGTRATPAWLDAEWAKLTAGPTAPGPVGIGFMTWALDRYPEQRALLTHALSLRPAAVLISFGDPRPYAPAIKAAGARLICQVQTTADARLALEAGADLLVAQGNEAGGHTGHARLRPLLAEVLGMSTGVPVVAAGGIATGADVAAVLNEGASGAMIGTRFVATPESLYHAQAKERIRQATAADTVYTSVFDIVQGIPWPSRYAGRALRNDFTEAWHDRTPQLQAALPDVRPTFDRAMVVYAGESVARISDVTPAADLVRRIGEEAAEMRR
jgi:nitronate monooxygenase